MAQPLLFQLGTNNISDDYITQVIGLTENLFQTHQKVLSGGLIIVHGLVAAVQTRIKPHLAKLMQYLLAAMTNSSSDQLSVRFACGLISDLT